MTLKVRQLIADQLLLSSPRQTRATLVTCTPTIQLTAKLAVGVAEARFCGRELNILLKWQIEGHNCAHFSLIHLGLLFTQIRK